MGEVHPATQVPSYRLRVIGLFQFIFFVVQRSREVTTKRIFKTG
jgi:hypothetical protein